MSHYKKEFEEKAIKHTKEMANEFANDIVYSIEASTIYRDMPDVTPDGRTTNIEFRDKTTSNAIIDVVSKYNGKVAALNYASYKYPGGGFIKGSTAQEEALCHDSTLYNVISDEKFEYEYACNRADLHNGLYTDFAIYSPDIVFVTDDEWFMCDVLTCPSPNYSAAKDNGVTYAENLECLSRRAEFMVKVAKKSGVDVLILGAWGCGVFGQDALDLAVVFRDLLDEYHFDTVIFSIPDIKKLTAFMQVFSGKGK